MAAMEERPPVDYREDEIDLGGYFAILRLYGPTEAAINKTWKPGDIELTASGAK